MVSMPTGRRCAALVIAAALLGCSSKPPTGKVTGEVTLDGQPVRDGSVMFIPADGQGQTAGAPIKDGEFVADEVPVTKMKVELRGNRVIGTVKEYDTPNSPLRDQVVEIVPPRYNAESAVTLDVKRGAQEVRYDLKSK